MTARHTPMRQSLDDYVDQVKRKEQFLADHPGASIAIDLEAPPHERWRGRLTGCAETTSHELAYVLDRLDDLVAARDAHARWPDWAFTRTLSGWQAQQADGSGVEPGRTLEQVETRIAQHEQHE